MNAARLVGGVALLACSQAHAPEAPKVIERRIAPHTANSAITNWTEDHFVWVTSSSPLGGQIMLLLPGTGGQPANAQLIGAIAAEQGYRVIGLMYADNLAVVQECAGDPAPECMANMRAEIIQGTDQSPHVAVDRDNSIDGRLADLIAYLAQTYPLEGWDSFLFDGKPNWNRIAVGGLSQGGGHAAYIAKLRAVPRVVMFGAPADGYSGEPAPWMSLGETHLNNYYGFRHQRDPFTSIPANWNALGLSQFAPVKNVDENTTVFDNSRMLTTDVLPATGSYDQAHASVFADGATPRRPNGAPVFEAAWRYLLGAYIPITPAAR